MHPTWRTSTYLEESLKLLKSPCHTRSKPLPHEQTNRVRQLHLQVASFTNQTSSLVPLLTCPHGRMALRPSPWTPQTNKQSASGRSGRVPRANALLLTSLHTSARHDPCLGRFEASVLQAPRGEDKTSLQPVAPISARIWCWTFAIVVHEELLSTLVQWCQFLTSQRSEDSYSLGFSASSSPDSCCAGRAELRLSPV